MTQYALYYYDQCPFCQMVLRILPLVKAEVEKRNTLTNPENRQALIKGGGRATVPCLLITHENGEEEWLYESRDIVQFLKQL